MQQPLSQMTTMLNAPLYGIEDSPEFQTVDVFFTSTPFPASHDGPFPQFGRDGRPEAVVLHQLGTWS